MNDVIWRRHAGITVSTWLCLLVGCGSSYTSSDFSAENARGGYGPDRNQSTEYATDQTGRMAAKNVTGYLSGGDPVAGTVGEFVGGKIAQQVIRDKTYRIEPAKFVVDFAEPDGPSGVLQILLTEYKHSRSSDGQKFVLWCGPSICAIEGVANLKVSPHISCFF